MFHVPLLRRGALGVALAGCASALAPCAGAQSADSLYPIRLLSRPTTLPRGASRLDLFTVAARQSHAPTGWTGVVGGGVGVTSQLEIGGQLVPATLAPGGIRLTTPSAYVTYTWSAGAASFAPTLQSVFPTTSDQPLLVDLGVPVYYTLGTMGYLAVAPTITVDTRQNGAGTTVSMPITLMRQVSDQFNLQLASGIGLSRFDPRFGLSRRAQSFEFDDTTVPLSAMAMYSIARGKSRHPLADLSLQWQWPQLYSRVRNNGRVRGNDWAVQLQASLYSIP